VPTPSHDVDPPLDARSARAAIHAAFPDIRADGLTHLGSGCDFDAFLTPDGWVFRFPKRADYARLLDVERRLLDLVAGVLPPRVRVPRIELVAEPGDAFPRRFVGYRLIEGVGADVVTTPLPARTARAVGEALGAVHGVPEADARAAGIREMGADDPGHQQWLDRRTAAAATLRGIDSVVDRALDWLAQQTPTPPLYRGPCHLVHHDLAPEHLLVAPGTGELVGIIDWSDAILGDPVRDFAPLAAAHGWAFTNSALRHYPLATDSTFRDRLQMMARLLSVLWLAEAHGGAIDSERDVTKHVRWVHNAFAA
jgi:aminoglycoside phosphotransferase (APT) family kinase protein